MIIGIRNVSNSSKYIFDELLSHDAQNISAYLVDGKSLFVRSSKKSPQNYPKLVMGNMARDGGNLILSDDEKSALVKAHLLNLIRKLLGAQEFIKGIDRWCLWITDRQLELARSIPPVNERLQKVYELEKLHLLKQPKPMHQYLICWLRSEETDAIIIPSTTSERRKYIPIGYRGP